MRVFAGASRVGTTNAARAGCCQRVQRLENISAVRLKPRPLWEAWFLRAGSSPIPSFLGGRGGLEEVCLRHGLGEVLHQWREARLWHVRDQVVEHAALAE